MMKDISEYKNGLIGTIVTHAVILALLLGFGFVIPVPLPVEEEGITVNFGDSETGFGLEEPAPGDREPSVNPIESASAQQAIPPPYKKVAASEEEEEDVLTQDLEETVVIKTPIKKKAKVIDPEKKRLEEAQRLENAEIARQKREQDQLLAQAAAEQRKVGEINSRAKNAFGGGGKGSPDSKSTSQGVTFGPGNQGTPGGVANADKYGPGSGTGNGTSYSLNGRSGLSLPKPTYPGNEEGIVVVQVTVDKNGIVTKAEPGVKGSNTANSELIAAARKAALQAKFNVDNNAPAFQTGTITYRFVLD